MQYAALRLGSFDDAVHAIVPVWLCRTVTSFPIFISNVSVSESFGCGVQPHGCSVPLCYQPSPLDASRGRMFWGLVRTVLKMDAFMRGRDRFFASIRNMGYR